MSKFSVGVGEEFLLGEGRVLRTPGECDATGPHGARRKAECDGNGPHGPPGNGHYHGHGRYCGGKGRGRGHFRHNEDGGF